MVRTKKASIAGVFCLTTLLLAAAPAISAVWLQTSQLTANSFCDYYPQGVGNNAVRHGCSSLGGS